MVSRFRDSLKGAQRDVLQAIRTQPQGEGFASGSETEQDWARRRRRYVAEFDECASRRPTAVQLGAAVGVGCLVVLAGYAAGVVQPPGWGNLFDQWASWGPMALVVGLSWVALAIGGLVWVHHPLRALAKRIASELPEVVGSQKDTVRRASAASKPRCLVAVARRNLTRAIELHQQRVLRRLAVSYHEARLKEHVRRLDRRVAPAPPATAQWGEAVPLEYAKPEVENAVYAPQTCRGAMPRATTTVVVGDLREEVDLYLRGIAGVDISRCSIEKLIS